MERNEDIITAGFTKMLTQDDIGDDVNAINEGIGDNKADHVQIIPPVIP